ncbi:PAS domain-containing protein [Methylobacterium sp. J-026]|nr:PAS domain-containing protein [Methylobacterium sp. J-026]
MAIFSDRWTASKLDALDRSQAVIEFGVDGTILTANKNFCDALNYRIEEIRGQKHERLVDPTYRDSAAYREFWSALRGGVFQAGAFKRIGKDGREVWLQATYNPVLGRGGKPVRIVKFASDVTEQVIRTIAYEGQINAINRSQAVIEFGVDGTILTANDNFLTVMGYRLEEIVGHRHSLFIEATERDGAAYRTFWSRLASGHYELAEFRRVAKDGHIVHIQGSYNPIFDRDGRLLKIVKFATDVTALAQDRDRRAELQGVIARDLNAIAEASANVSQQAGQAAGAATEVGSEIQAVASGAEQLATSVTEISSQVAQASEISGRAVD